IRLAVARCDGRSPSVASYAAAMCSAECGAAAERFARAGFFGCSGPVFAACVVAERVDLVPVVGHFGVALRAVFADAVRAVAAAERVVPVWPDRAWLLSCQNGPGSRCSGHAAHTLVQRFR